MSLTAEQKELKKTSIGASEIAIVAGVHPYKTPLDLWLEKTGRTPAFDGNEYTELGHHFEAIVADWHAKRHGVEVVDLGLTLVHPEHDFCVATPDRIIMPDSQLLEIKTVWTERSAARWGDSGSDEVPEEHICQVQWQAMILEALGYPQHDTANIAACLTPKVGSSEGARREYVVPLRPKLQARLLEMAHEFWGYVKRDEAPPLVAGEDPLKLYREHKTEELIEADDEQVAQLVRDFIAAKAVKKEAEGKEARLRAEIGALIGDKAGIMGSWGQVSWKANKGSEKFDLKMALADGAIPQQVIEKYTSLVPGARVMRPKLKKED